MLNENIKAIRKSKGLSQQELAINLNVVRQTISKWEQGLSVPDSDMLISISEVLETHVRTLLGETVIEAEVDNLKAISEKLESCKQKSSPEMKKSSAIFAEQKMGTAKLTGEGFPRRPGLSNLLIQLCVVSCCASNAARHSFTRA